MGGGGRLRVTFNGIFKQDMLNIIPSTEYIQQLGTRAVGKTQNTGQRVSRDE
jgi:hypothetical protein